MAYRGPWIPGEEDGRLSPGLSPARSYATRNEAGSIPWASGARDAWRTTPEMLRLQRQQPRQRPPREYLTANSPASSPGFLRQTRQNSSLQLSVEAFLLSLPLGDDPDSLEVESRVAERLYEDEEARSVLQEKLRQWSEVAMELFAMISELRASRGAVTSPSGGKPDPATLSAIKSVITSFVLEQQQQTLNYDRADETPSAVRRVAAPQPLPGGSGNSLDTPTVHHHHHPKLQQPSQPHLFSDSASAGAMSTPHGPQRNGGGQDDGQQQPVEYKSVEVLQLRQEVMRLRAELAWERAGGAATRHQNAQAAADGSDGAPVAGRHSGSPARTPSAGLHTSEHDHSLATSAMVQVALVPKAPQAQQDQQQAALVDALRAELEVARVAVAERGAQATTASEEAQRLRRALLDAEIELQQAAVVGDAARKQLTQTEEEVAALRASNARLVSDLEAERGKTTAVAAVVRQQLSQALSDLALCQAEIAAKDAEAKELGARLAARTSELAMATQQVTELRSAAMGTQPQSERERLSAELAATREELRRLQQVLMTPLPDLAGDVRASFEVSETLRLRLERLQVALDECQRLLLDEQRPQRRQYEQGSGENAQEPPSPIRADHLSGALREVEELRRQLAAALAAALEEREAQTQAHEEELQRLQDQLEEARAATDMDKEALRQQLTDAGAAVAALRSEVGRLRQQLEASEKSIADGSREVEELRQRLDEAEADLEAARQGQQELLDRLADSEAEAETRIQELDRLRGLLEQAQGAAQTSSQEAEAMRSRLEALVAMDAAAANMAERAEDGRLKLEAEAEELRRRLRVAQEHQAVEVHRVNELLVKQSALEEERDQLADRCLRLQHEWNEIRAKYDNLRLDREELAGRCDRLQQERDALKQQYSKLYQEHDMLKERYSKLHQEQDKLKEQYGRLQQERDDLKDQYGKLQQERDEFKDQYGRLQQERNEFKEQYGAAQLIRDELMDRYDTLQQERDKLKDRYSMLQQEWTDLKDQYAMLQQVRDELMDRYDELQQENDKLKGQYSMLQQARDELKDRYGTLQQVRDDLMERHGTAQQEQDELQIQYRMLQQERDALKDRYQSLQKERDELKDQHDMLRQERDGLRDEFHTLQQESDELQDQHNKLDKEYRELKDHHCKLEEHVKTLTCANHTISELRAQMENLQRDVQSTMARNARLTAELGTKQAALDEAEAEVSRVTSAKEALIVQNEALVVENGQLLRNHEALSADFAAVHDEFADLQSQVAELQLQREQTAAVEAELQQQLAEAHAALGASKSEAASLHARLIDSQQLANQADKDLDELRQRWATTTAALDAQTREADALREEKAKLQAGLKSNEERLGELHHRVLVAKQAVEDRGRDLDNLRQQLADKHAEVEASGRKLQELRGQLAEAVRAVEEREQKAEELRWQKAELQALVDAKDRATEELRREYAAAVAVAEGASRDLAAASRMEAAELSQRLAAAKEELAEVRRAAAAANMEVDELSQRLKAAEEVAEIVTHDSNKFCAQLREQLARAQDEARLLSGESDRVREQFAASQDAVEALEREVKSLRQQLALSQDQVAAGNKEVKTLRRQLARAREAAAAGSKEVDDLMLHLAEAQSEAAVAIRQADELCQQMDEAHVAVEAAVREADQLRQRLADGEQQHHHQQQLIDEQARAYQEHPAKQALARQAQVLAEQAVEQQVRVAALQRQLEEVHRSLTALASRSQQLIQENVGLRRQLDEAQRAERVAREAAEQARQGGDVSEEAQLVDALDAEREARMKLEGLVEELRQQLDGARLRSAELRKRAAAAEAARSEALTEAAAAAALRADTAAATSAHVAELEQSLEEMRSREEQMSRTLDETVHQATEQAATIAALQGELRAYEQVQHHVISGLQRMINGEAPSIVRPASGGGSGGGMARRSSGLTPDVHSPGSLRKSGGGGSISPVFPSHQHLRTALMVARQRILALEDYLTTKSELVDDAPLVASVEGVRYDSAVDVHGSDSGFGRKASHSEAAARGSPIDQLASVEKRLAAAQSVMSQQEAHVASLERELRQRRSAAGFGATALAAARSLGLDLEEMALAAEHNERASRSDGRPSAQQPSSEVSTAHYSFGDDVPSHLAPGSIDWMEASDELPAVVSSDGVTSTHDGTRRNGSETVQPGPGSLTMEEGEVEEAEEEEEEEQLQLQQIQLQQQLVELGAEVAGLQERLSQEQAENEVEAELLGEALALAEAGVTAVGRELLFAQQLQPSALPKLRPNGGDGSRHGSGGSLRGSSSAIGLDATIRGNFTSLGTNKSASVDAPPVRSLVGAFAAAAMDSGPRSRNGSGAGSGTVVEGRGVTSSRPLSRRSSGQTTSPAHSEASFSLPGQRHNRQSQSRLSMGSLLEAETAVAMADGQLRDSTLMEPEDSHQAADSGHDGGRLASVLSARHRYNVTDSASVVYDDGADDEGRSEGINDERQDIADPNAGPRFQPQKEWPGDQSHQTSSRASRSSVNDGAAAPTAGGISAGGSSHTVEGQDSATAAVVITLGGASADNHWKGLPGTATTTVEVAGEADPQAEAKVEVAEASPVGSGPHVQPLAGPVNSVSTLDKDLTDLRNQLKQLDNLLLSQRSRQAAASPPTSARGSARGTPSTATMSLPAPGNPGPSLWAQYMTAAAAALASGGPGGDTLLEGSQHAASLIGATSAAMPSLRSSTPASVRVSPRARPVAGGHCPVEAVSMEGDGGGYGGGGGTLRLAPYTIHPDESLMQGPGSGSSVQPTRRL